MSSRSYLILHGIENHQPPEHWQSWLAGQLRDRGHDVLYPGLPDPDAPAVSSWMAELHSLLGAMGGSERVVICHSLACMLWFHIAPHLRASERVDRLVFVSPPASECIPPPGAGFRLTTIDATAVRASVETQITVICSDCDPYNPGGADVLYGDSLGARVIVLRGAGHITPADGYGPWPSLAQWCEDPHHPITGS